MYFLSNKFLKNVLFSWVAFCILSVMFSSVIFKSDDWVLEVLFTALLPPCSLEALFLGCFIKVGNSHQVPSHKILRILYLRNLLPSQNSSHLHSVLKIGVTFFSLFPTTVELFPESLLLFRIITHFPPFWQDLLKILFAY